MLHAAAIGFGIVCGIGLGVFVLSFVITLINELFK